MNQNNSIRVMTETATLIAMAVVLEFVFKMIPFLQWPQGGSASIVMLPLMIVGFRHGVRAGMTAGFIFGILNFFIDGYTFHWGSFVFDYGLAFIVIGSTGFFKEALKGNRKSLIIGILLAGFLRYLMHSLSGLIFINVFFPDMSPFSYETFIYSFVVYNLPYMAASTALCLLIGLLIHKRLAAIFDMN